MPAGSAVGPVLGQTGRSNTLFTLLSKSRTKVTEISAVASDSPAGQQLHLWSTSQFGQTVFSDCYAVFIYSQAIESIFKESVEDSNVQYNVQYLTEANAKCHCMMFLS